MNLLKHRGGDVRVFLDEEKCVVDEVANRRRSWAIVSSRDDVPSAMKSKNPKSVMVFGSVASDGHVMPPHFIPAGVRVDTKE